MRTHKYKAWHTEQEVMFEIGDKFGTTHDLDCVVYLRQGQPVELIEYTGKEDRDGEEIYNGDYLDVDNGARMVEVVWNDALAMFDTEARGRINGKLPFTSLENGSWRYRCKKIGNRYENPELLEA